MSKKRAKGEGSLRKLPCGTWYCQYMDGYKPNGKRNMRSLSAPTRAEVLQKLRVVQNQKKEAAAKTIAFDQWAQKWLTSYQNQVQPSTFCNYRYTARLLCLYFGRKPLQEIKAMEINSLMEWLRGKGYSVSQLAKCRAMLIQLFDAAEANDLVAKNYARKSFRGLRSNSPGQSHSKDSFTQDEIRTLMEKLPDDLTGNSIRLLLTTGMRVQELLALQPADIAADGSAIKITKAIKLVEGGAPQLGPPKSARSYRTVPVPTPYRPLAVWLRENGGQAFIWCSRRDDLLYNVATFRQKYYRILQRIPGVRRLSPHSCRHTYITMLQREGVPMEVIARLTGHGDIRTTDHYLHVDLPTMQTAAEQLANAFTENREDKAHDKNDRNRPVSDV